MTRKRPREQRMREIVAAAVSEFIEKGYEGASMDAIAVRAGLTKGGLYHHFRGKDEILVYANLQLAQPVERILTQALKEPSAVGGLRLYLRRYVEHWVKHPEEVTFFFLTLTKILSMPESRQLYADYYRRLRAALTSLYERGRAAGELVAHDSAARATALLVALDGAIGYLALDPKLKAGRVAADLEAVFVSSLLAAPSGGRAASGGRDVN